jgi:adenine/guanine phosphoribosyltransferase-like PRPP-binding protein
MRTTLALDDDVLIAARAIAQSSNRSIGEVVSDLARQALRPAAAKGAPHGASLAERNGIPLIPRRAHGTIITPELVNALRDETP